VSRPPYANPIRPRLRRLASRLRRDRSGSIAILTTVCLLVMMGMAGFALDLAQAYFARATGQRIADQSAVAAAFAYSNSSNSQNVAQRAAQSLATTNGIGGGTVTTQIVNSPANDGNKAAMVTVTTPVSVSPFGLTLAASAQHSGSVLSFNVSATAYAEIQQSMAPCLVALGSAGVSASGGTTISASGCAVSSDGNVAGSGGAQITAQGIYAVGTISPTGTGCNGGACVSTSPASGEVFPGSSAPTDPYAAANVFSRMSTVAALAAPVFPSLGSVTSGGAALTCSTSSPTLTVASGVHGTVSTSYYPTCSTINFTGGAETDIGGSGLQLTGNAVTLNFAAGVYKINGISLSGSTAVTINTSGAVTFEIWNGISTSGSTSVTFNGPATYDVQGGISNGANGAMVFTNNGGGASSFTVAGGISVTNGSASFPAGTYSITSGGSSGYGIYVSATPVTFGNGSFNIAGGIYAGGGDTLTFGGALNAGSVFQVEAAAGGNDALATGGGGSFTIGSFTNVDLDGNVLIAGNLSLGAGAYTIDGTLNASASGGNSIIGTSVSIVAAGAVSLGAGYSTVSLSAPSTITGATQGSAGTVVLASEATGGSTVTAGATGTTLVGTVYTPNGALTVAGAGHISGGGGCAEVVASSLNFSGGGSLSTTCSLSGGSGGGALTVALVQ
jgi:Flp pilus assembly protein TadG